MQKFSQKSGSALLISVLVMGILMVLTLGLSDLVIREIRQTGDVVATGKAYFSAEAGIENALLDLHENLPGYELPYKNGRKEVKVQVGTDKFHYRYKIENKADELPFFDPEKVIFLDPKGEKVVQGELSQGHSVPKEVLYKDYAEATYNVLPLNESIVIPLSDVEDFLIEYYFNPHTSDANNDLLNNPHNFNNFDILRWKIFGHPKDVADPKDASKTDAISDFYPALYTTNAQMPTCIGTDPSLDAGCSKPAGEDPDAPGNFDWSGARECYTTETNSSLGENAEIKNNCTIKEFIQHHTQNYLVLTNVVNPQIIGIDDPKNPNISLERANIYYRIIARKDADKHLVREAASVSSDGFAADGKIKQSIDVQISLSSFLPVFHFSLYRTDADQKILPPLILKRPL